MTGTYWLPTYSKLGRGDVHLGKIHILHNRKMSIFDTPPHMTYENSFENPHLGVQAEIWCCSAAHTLLQGRTDSWYICTIFK